MLGAEQQMGESCVCVSLFVREKKSGGVTRVMGNLLDLFSIVMNSWG